MPLVASEHDLFQACRTLFGNETGISREFLQYLQPQGIKNAYRQKALATHPDRVATQGREAEKLNAEQFRLIKKAYEDLTAFLKARERGFRFPSRWAASKPGNNKPAQTAGHNSSRKSHSAGPFAFSTESLYEGQVPERPLLFGHFLYYSGLINWRTIIQALVWQRTQRPRLGEIGCGFGLFKERDILTILKNRKMMQPFGQSAIELGMLSESQLKIMVAHQSRIQKKIGAFFLENQLFSKESLRRLILKHQEHNARFQDPPPISHILF